MPPTKQFKQYFFLTVLEAGKSKVKVLADSVCGEGPIPSFQMAAFSLCPHIAEREIKRDLGAPLMRALIPCMRAPPSSDHLSKAPPPSEGEVAQLCPTRCSPMDCSLPGSSIHGIFQARVLEWVAISFSTGSSRPRDRTRVSCIAGRCFTL